MSRARGRVQQQQQQHHHDDRHPTASLPSTWELAGADPQNTRDVGGPINSSNVSTLGVAWTVPIIATGTFGAYATTPVVSNGVVYTQDLASNVYAINLETGKLLWIKKYNSPDEGPNGVTVANGTVYGATSESAFALQAATGEQLWSKKLTRNASEGIDMAPGYYNGTVYVSTVPGNTKAFYTGNGQAILWALNAETGATKWKWEEVPKNLWSNANTNINSGGGQWDPPTFDREGNLYIGIANPAPFPGTEAVPVGHEPTRTEPLHGLDRQAQRADGQADVVLPADAARHLRPRPGELADPGKRRRHADRDRRRQGGDPGRGQCGNGQAGVEDARRRAQRHGRTSTSKPRKATRRS